MEIRRVKLSETVLTAILVIAGFVLSDFIVEQLYIEGALPRFFVRVGFQAQFITLIYLFFESRDLQRRLKKLESDDIGETREEMLSDGSDIPAGD